MEYMDLTVKELFDQQSEEELRNLFVQGIKNDIPVLIIPAMNTLISRGNTGYVVEWLGTILEKDSPPHKLYYSQPTYRDLRGACISADTRKQIARSLAKCKTDQFLQKFGKFLLKNKGDNPFLEFVSSYPGNITTKQYIIGIHNGRCVVSSIEEVEKFKHWYDDLAENMRQNWLGIR